VIASAISLTQAVNGQVQLAIWMVGDADRGDVFLSPVEHDLAGGVAAFVLEKVARPHEHATGTAGRVVPFIRRESCRAERN
jgi:hypothetical protein